MQYLRAQQGAARAALDETVLVRMPRVRRALNERLERTQESPDGFIVLVGPFEDRGIQVRAVRLENAREWLPMTGLALDRPPPGNVLVFAWNRYGLTSLRCFPLAS